MTRLARALMGAAQQLTTASGSLYGSGSLAVPAGCVLVTLTGKGAAGGDNSWYDPGQAFLPAVTGQAYIAPHLEWENVSANSYFTNTPGTPDILPSPSSAGQTWSGNITYQWNAATSNYFALTAAYVAVTNPGQPYIAAFAGQPYIAPSSGGGIYSGANTTATLNGVTDTWAGGNGGPATESTQTLASTGAGQTLTYAIASGGSLSYSYTY